MREIKESVYMKRRARLAAFLAGPVERAEARTGRKKLDQAFWCRRTRKGEPNRVGVEPAMCHTAACALGWATVLWPERLVLRYGFVVPAKWKGLSQQTMDRRAGYHLDRIPYLIGAKFFGISLDTAAHVFGPTPSTPAEKALELLALEDEK